MTLVASAMAGGDCIAAADVLRTGGTACTLGTILRSFRWGHVRQLDRVSRELLARAWAAGAGPGDAPFTIDLDSTICETYGLAKEGARHHGYTGARGYHPLLAIAAGTGDVLMARLREGRANATPGPTDDSRYGPTAGCTLMAWYPSAARWMSASPSPSASTRACAISSRRYPRMPGLPFPTGADQRPVRPGVFDDHRLVANAGLLLPATLARHLGLRELVDHHLDLGGAPGRANTGDKLMTLVASAMAGGDCIAAADVLRTGGTACTWAARSRHLPPQLPVGPRPPVGPGEPGAAGPGLGGWGRTRRRAVHHRPRFDHLRDLRTGQGGRPPPRLYRCAGLPPRCWPSPPAPETC